jgi:hypothetical protein
MMSARECLAFAAHPPQGATFQHAVNQFMDDFRRATPEQRTRMVADPITGNGRLEALIAAVVEALSVEVGLAPPPWARTVSSPEPFFAFEARTFPLRARLMIESPPAFRIRRVFVPENYLSRH